MAISPKDKSILYLVLKTTIGKIWPPYPINTRSEHGHLYISCGIFITQKSLLSYFLRKNIGAVSAHCPDTNMIRRVQMDTCSSTRATMYLFGGNQMKMGKSMSQKMPFLYFHIQYFIFHI